MEKLLGKCAKDCSQESRRGEAEKDGGNRETGKKNTITPVKKEVRRERKRKTWRRGRE